MWNLRQQRGLTLKKLQVLFGSNQGGHLNRRWMGYVSPYRLGREEVSWLGEIAKIRGKGLLLQKNFRAQHHPELEAIESSRFNNTVLDGELTEGYKKDGTLNKDTLARIKNGDFTGFYCLVLSLL